MTQLPPFGEFSRRNCFEFRMGIEGEAAAAAARNRSEADLQSLWSLMQRLEDVRERAELGLDEDFDFHLAVARASGNHYFVSVLNSLKDSIFEGMLLARTTTGLHTVEKLAAINEQHRLVYQAILDQDENGARLMMRSHLSRCKQSTAHWDVFSAHAD
jgi:GntR family transcriptional regulator, transcriptional repressor for pyruvate dehydrogenase complex